ncbi:MAG: hypothetical protein M0006_01950 [Magnetospirillum sp.]|nr:hypothetical protein [Magnetospirillum sp.]
MTDLEPMIGGSGRVSEVMNRRRPLTLAMIRRLHDGLGLPAEVLVREYPWRRGWREGRRGRGEFCSDDLPRESSSGYGRHGVSQEMIASNTHWKI